MAWNGHHWSNSLPLPGKKSSGIKERTKRIPTTPLLKIVIFCGCRRIINESNIHDVLGWVPRVEFVSSAHVTDTRLHQPSIVPLNRERMNFTFRFWKLVVVAALLRKRGNFSSLWKTKTSWWHTAEETYRVIHFHMWLSLSYSSIRREQFWKSSSTTNGIVGTAFIRSSQGDCAISHSCISMAVMHPSLRWSGGYCANTTDRKRGSGTVRGNAEWLPFPPTYYFEC